MKNLNEWQEKAKTKASDRLEHSEIDFFSCNLSYPKKGIIAKFSDLYERPYEIARQKHHFENGARQFLFCYKNITSVYLQNEILFSYFKTFVNLKKCFDIHKIYAIASKKPFSDFKQFVTNDLSIKNNKVAKEMIYEENCTDDEFASFM